MNTTTRIPLIRPLAGRLIPCAAPLAAILLGAILPQGIAGESAKQPSPAPAVAPAAAPSLLTFAGGAIRFDVEERLRWEARENLYDFNDDLDSLTDDNWFLQRFRLGLLVKPASWFRLYAQVQDSREFDSDRPDFPGLLGAEGDDSFDLRQGWVEFGDVTRFPLTVRLGRQVLSYGDERLIGAFDWNNIGRTFDAARLRWEEKDWSLEAFAASVVVPERGSYNQSDLFNGNETEREQILSGLYFSTTALGPQTTDLYAFQLHENANPHFAQNPFGDTDFLTLGVRVKSKPGAFARQETGLAKDGKSVVPVAPRPVGFDYDGEFAWQTGSVLGLDLRAFAVHGGLGYTFDTAWLPRLGLAYNFATGDDEPGDRNVQTFQNLFPTNHKFYGQMDLFSWQNMHDLELSVKAQPLKAVSVKTEFHAFWLETTEDAWYRANGVSTVRTPSLLTREAGAYAGSEVDLVATWNVNAHLQVEGGYSHFFAGDYLKDTGVASDADFGYVQAKLTF